MGYERANFDCDGDVDLADYCSFASCLRCPGSGPANGCHQADLDGDNDVDLVDLVAFQAAPIRLYRPVSVGFTSQPKPRVSSRLVGLAQKRRPAETGLTPTVDWAGHGAGAPKSAGIADAPGQKRNTRSSRNAL